MPLLSGRRAIITGAAQGIGAATARKLMEHGASVVIADLNASLAQDTARELAKLGGTAVPVKVDVRNPDEVQAAVELCVAELGGLDILVNNAGITRDATLRKMTVDDFEAVIDVHLKGAFLATKSASLAMRDQGTGGAIINISSISGKVGMIGQANYSAAKAGLVGFTKAVAKELAPHNIRVNAIQPGLIRTAMTEALRPDVWESKLAEIPLRRAGEPEDIGNAVVFLASELSSYITGVVLEVAGGRHI